MTRPPTLFRAPARRAALGACLLAAACAPGAPQPLGAVSLDAVPGGRGPTADAGTRATVRLEAPARREGPDGYRLAALPAAAWTEARATCHSPTAMTAGAGKSLAFASWTYHAGGTPYYQNNAGTFPLPAVRPAADYRVGYDLLAAVGSTQIVRASASIAGQTLQPGANALHLTLRPNDGVATFAGTPEVDGPAANAVFCDPLGVVMGPDGNLYVADSANQLIRRVDMTAGTVSTLAGNLTSGYTNATGAAAQFSGPSGLLFGADGSLLVSESGNCRIRKVNVSTGAVTLYAGNGSGYVDGAAGVAKFGAVYSLARDAAGNLYFADQNNHCIRRIDAATGEITTLAGRKPGVDEAGNPVVWGYADGVGASAAFKSPRGIAFDGADTLYVTDWGNHCIRKVAVSTGAVTTLAGTPTSSGGTDGPGASAKFSWPSAVCYDAGYLYVVESAGTKMRRVDCATGDVLTVAGGSSGYVDSPAPTSARFKNPYAVTRDPAGNFYVAETSNQTIRKVVLSGPSTGVTTVAGGLAAGLVNGPVGTARFRKPQGLAQDAAGNLYVTDTYNDVIRKIAPDGTVSSVGNVINRPRSVCVGTDGFLYVAEASHRIYRGPLAGGAWTLVAGGGGADKGGYLDATGSAALFNSPYFMVMGSTGALFITDTSNHCIRRLDVSTGAVTTFAGLGTVSGYADGPAADARFNQPIGLAIDAADNLYVSEQGSHHLRKIAPDGTVTTLAGSSSGSTEGVGGKLSSPTQLVLDGKGCLYVADRGNRRVRKLLLDGYLATVAGNGSNPDQIDGAPETARFRSPFGLQLAADGSLYVSDSVTHSIRKIP